MSSETTAPQLSQQQQQLLLPQPTTLRTPMSTSVGLEDNKEQGNTTTSRRRRLRVRVRRWHGVANWTWNAGEQDEVCGICQSAFEGVAPGVKYPGDECPVVWGRCGHPFHLQCVSTWLTSSRNTCPMCRQEWEFGESKAST